ncbi:MAG TPA: carboxypeptidase-like regulatory domain-containing protein, partial [Thermoanaerobaculia bacterium]
VDEKGFIAGVPAIPGVQRISADADLFDTTTTLLAVARESGIVLLPYGKLAMSGFADPSGPPVQGDVRLWLRRRSDGKLIRRTEPVGPGNAVSVSIPGGEWDLVLKAPARAPVTAAVNLPPGAEGRVSFDRAPSGLSVAIRSVQSDGKKAVPRASVRWKGLPPLTLREITLHASPTPADELLALSVNDDAPATDPAGSLRLEHLPVQTHVWTITADGYRTASESVEVRANDTQKSVTVAMRPLPDIVVSVEDRVETPIRLAVDVSARAPGADTGLPLRPVWSGAVAKGAVQRLSRVKEADYRFDLRDESKVLLSQTWVSSTDKVWQQDLIPVRLVHEPRTVRGKVTRGDEPVAGVFLYADVQTRGGPEVEMLIPADKFLERAARSGPDGSYSLEIGGPGIFRIRYTIPEQDVNGTAGTVDLTAALSADLDFSIARNRLAIDVVSARNGKPIPGADLRITMGRSNGRRGSSYDAQTDDQGRYVASGLDDVRAVVRASADGYETRTVDLALKESDEGTEPAKIEL